MCSIYSKIIIKWLEEVEGFYIFSVQITVGEGIETDKVEDQ